MSAGPAVDRPQVCVGAIVIDDDRLLLIRRGQAPAKGKWSVPGGRVEHGETLAEAVVREVLEETGVEVVCERFLGWAERFDEGMHAVILDFVATPLERDPALRAGDDAAECTWVPIWEVPEYPLVAGLAEFLADHQVIDLLS